MAPVGTTVRISTPGQPAVLSIVAAITRTGRQADPGFDVVAALDRQAPMTAQSTFEVVEAELAVDDQDPARLRQERHTALGLGPAHSRFLADVLTADSRLVEAVTDGTQALLPDADLLSMDAVRVAEGEDRWGSITLADIFPYGSEPPGTGGLDAIRGTPEVATMVVPDLYAPFAAAPEQGPEVPAAGLPGFGVCAPRPPTPAAVAPSGPLTGLRLDPAVPAEFDRIVERQRQLVQLAEDLQVVALLDVPPGVRPAQVPHWRSHFDSSYAAAYHPWPRGVSPQNTLVPVPPSAVAAGLIARCELREGISRGAANEVAGGIVDVTDHRRSAARRIAPAGRGRLPDGNRRRLSHRCQDAVAGSRVAAAQRAQAVAADRAGGPAAAAVDGVRAQRSATQGGLRQQLDMLLAILFDEGCFAGATAEDSWFVNVASDAMLAAEADSGQLVVEVGVAPSEPIEYIVVRVAVQAEGTIKTTVTTGPGVVGHG